MKVSIMCMECNIKQIHKIATLQQADDEQQKQALKRVLRMLSEITFTESNPEIMSKTWKILQEEFDSLDPYQDVKHHFNVEMMKLYPELKQLAYTHQDPLDFGLKLAVLGNLIDFGARHTFTHDDIIQRINDMDTFTFAIDHRKPLFEQLQTAKTLLYIGDNCGEIVFDKLFLEQIKEQYPNLTIYFAVRGGPILNDITVEDANFVNMEEVATVVTSGVAYPGTVIEKCSKEFQELFHNSDIVIAKGQGNYEGLSDTHRNGLFLVLMAKCAYVASMLGVQELDYIITENR